MAMLVLACRPELAPPAPRPDGGLRDGGTFDAGPSRPRDAGHEDGGREDGGRRDAGTPDSGASDGGPPPGIVIDGVIGAAEWADVGVERSSVVATGIFAGSALTSLRAVRDATRLYVAIEGTLGTSHAIVMYVDHDVGGADGLVSPTPLEDFSGALDAAITKELFTPAELRIDLAWGTLDMNRVAGASDERMGWRDVGTSPDAFRAVDGARAPTACSANACETSISLADLGVRAGEDVGLFVRLVSTTSIAMSNQTLPMDDPLAPEVVSTYLVLR